jgi:hypothetical protein
MKWHKTMPDHAVDGWPSKDVHHDAGSEPFHYHDVEEWLEVREGTITFYTAGEKAYELTPSNALNIQPGEVHRAEIGPQGVAYRIWLPVDISGKTFQHNLDVQDYDLLRRNLELPNAENRWEETNPRSTAEANPDGKFLSDFTSAELKFRNAGGKYFGKEAYLKRPPAGVRRIPSDTVCIVYKTAGSVLLSTVVGTESKETGTRQYFMNIRLFVREENSLWRCQVWMNFPVPGPD